MGPIIGIDIMAQRYGLLPSEVLSRATTFDSYICNSALRYQQIREAEANNNFDHYTEDELLAIKDSI
jgi:hypothetical protein